jgi:hypothetical protein
MCDALNIQEKKELTKTNYENLNKITETWKQDITFWFMYFYIYVQSTI